MTRESTRPSTTLPTGDEQQGRHHVPADHHTAGCRRDREPVDEERARVVEEALSLEDHEQPVRRVGAARAPRWPRRRRAAPRWRRARWRPPRGGRARTTGRRRHGRHGESDREQRQARHRAPVVPQVPRRRVERRVEQHRRHEERQRQLGIEGDGWSAGDQRERGAGQREERGIGQVDSPGQRGERGSDQEQRDHELEHFHDREATRRAVA